MKLRLASRLAAVVESSTLKMSAATRALSQKGVKVYNFAAGEPDFPVPAPIAKAAVDAINSGFSKYTPVPGILELRKKIAEKLWQDNGLKYSAEEIVVSAGAKQAIFNFLLAVLDEGDEVIISAPYWVSYPEMVKIAGGTPVIVPTTAEQGFRMSPQQLKETLSPRTKALILNSPSNPTGSLYSRSELTALAKELEGTDVIVCSDEIYEKLVFEGEFSSFGAVSADAFSRTVTVNGFSKTYAMTGWRLGYAAGPKPVIDAMNVLQGQSTSGANSVTQKAALAALDMTDKDLAPMISAFRKRRDRMMEIFSQYADLSYVRPSGAFYLFLNVEKVLGSAYNHDEILTTSEELAMYLLSEAHVGTVPGGGFGCPEYIRLSYAVSDSDVEEGSRRIIEAIKKLR